VTEQIFAALYVTTMGQPWPLKIAPSHIWFLGCT